MPPPAPDRTKRIEQIFGFAALCLLLIGCFVVLSPFISAAMWAFVLGFTLWPIHRRLLRWVGNRRAVAAFLTTASIALVLVVPFVIIGASVADDVRALGAAMRRWAETGPPEPPAWIEKVPLVGQQAKEQWQELADDAALLMQRLKQAASEAPENGLTNQVADPLSVETPLLAEAAAAAPAAPGESRLIKTFGAMISSTRSFLLRVGLAIGGGVIEIGLSVFLTFFIFYHGAEGIDRLGVAVRRIAGERGSHLLLVAGNTVRGVVYGILGTALVQGAMAGVGFLIAGVPGAALLGLLTFFLSIVPMGPPLIWIPAAIWLFNQGSIGWGIFMVIWGLGVSSVDNIVRPWLISQGSAMPFILIFFGVIGGALAFGFIGVFLGPTLLAVAFRLVEEFSAVAPARSAVAAAVGGAPRPPPEPEAKPEPKSEPEPEPLGTSEQRSDDQPKDA